MYILLGDRKCYGSQYYRFYFNPLSVRVVYIYFRESAVLNNYIHANNEANCIQYPH